MTPTYRIVEVWWEDAQCEHDQTTIEDLADDQPVVTVGYLVREREQSITVAAEVLDGDPVTVRGATRIPRGMIRDVRELRRAKARRPRIGDTPTKGTRTC